MAYLGQTFNTADLPESESMEPVPAGVYSVVVDDAELKATNKGTGQYINLKLKVVDGQYRNRVMFDIINIDNPNQTATNIGLATLNKIMKAMNLQAVQDTDQLIGGQLVVKVVIEESIQYGDKNKVKDYQSTGGNTSPNIPNVAQPQQQAPAQLPQQQQNYAQQQPQQQNNSQQPAEMSAGFDDGIPF